MAGSLSDVTTNTGLKELNEHLASRTYLGGGGQATSEDFALFSKVAAVPDVHKFPHARRWCQHLTALKTLFPLRDWPRSNASAGGKGKDQANLEGLLPHAEMGKVVTRFPPEPSGYLHIGHAKAAMMNNHFARFYNGKLILRFDDTNPTKEKAEFEESIISDLKTLEVVPDRVTHTSDSFEDLQNIMHKLIKDGKCYIDDTDAETMQKERFDGIPSKRRDQPVAENLRLWGEMLKGSEEGLRNCVRAKIDMQNKNKCLRDPVFYRCKTDVPHHQTGWKYKSYPTYDFACPCVDAMDGVTHALRTIEYKDRDPMYEWVLEATGLRKVHLVEFSKTQFSHTILSKRKLALFVDNGWVEGWNDPRFPTVQGVLRRGMTVEGLRDFVLTQGMSKATNLMEWDKIWAINKQKIDPVVPRYAGIGKLGAVLLKLDGPPEPMCKLEKKHPKNEEMGERLLMLAKEVWVEQEDAADISEGEQVTLLHWGNIFVDKIHRGAEGVSEMVGRLNLAGNVKDTKKKIHWVPKLDEQVTNVVLREFDHLVTKAKIEDDDQLADLINPCSLIDTEAVGDPMLKTLNKGDKIQLERRGFFIVDAPALARGKPMVLIKIPDGKAKDMGISSKVDPSKLQGQQSKKVEKNATSKELGGAAGPEADKKAHGKGGEKAKAKAKAGGGKPADRPINDITRLNIRVGRMQKVWPHPDAEKLFCEEIDLGEPNVRTIASGLRAHMKEEDMIGQLVVVLANLKPRKMQGFESQGMVLCATSAEGKVELLKPPAGAKVGERVNIEGFEMADPDEKLNEKTGKAPLEGVREGLRTDAERRGTFKGAVWQTSTGPVTAETVANGTIS